MKIPDGPFQGKDAVLVLNCDCVLIEDETGFCVKDGELKFPMGYDERDLSHIYDLLRKKA